MDYNILPEMIGLATALPDVAGLGVDLATLIAIGSTLLFIGLIAKDELSIQPPGATSQAR